jgi:hypothetical protein
MSKLKKISCIPHIELQKNGKSVPENEPRKDAKNVDLIGFCKYNKTVEYGTEELTKGSLRLQVLYPQLITLLFNNEKD